LFSVDNAEVGTIDPSDAVDGTVTITPGFRSTLIFGVNHAANYNDVFTNNAYFSFGVCDENLNQGHISQTSVNGAASATLQFWTRNDGFSGRVSNNHWHEITSITATQFVVTTRNGTQATLRIGYLALDTGDRDTFVDNVAIPNAPGNTSYNVGFESQIAGFLQGLAEADNTTYLNDLANSFGAGAATPNDEYTQISTGDDGAGTTDTQSLSESQIIAIPDLPGSVDIDATWVSFTTPNVTVNYSNVATNAKRTVIWAIEEEEEPPPPTPTPTVTTPFIPSHEQQKTLSILVFDPLVKDSSDKGINIAGIVDSYSHESRRVGGYYSGNIGLSGKEIDLDEWVSEGIGKHIETYNPGGVVVWEGFVNKVTITSGGDTFSIGPLTAIANRIAVTYSPEDTSVDPPLLGARTTTAVANNTESQGLYGIWHKIFGINGATATGATQLRDTLINHPTRIFPPTSGDISLSGGSFNVSLELLGYWHFLKAYLYENAAISDIDLSQKAQDILAADPNSIFSTNYTKIKTNVTQVSDAASGERFSDAILTDLNSRGDSADDAYSIGFYEGRVLTYASIPTEIKYYKRRGATVTSESQAKIDPWDINPAEWFFRPDFLVGRHPPLSTSTLGTDPRSGLIETVKYSTPYGLGVQGNFELGINGVKVSEVDQALARRGLGGTG
ncbi:MAG: hypothetical protein ACXABY_29485, partial [Candidatus Thorarchaeota archaeon]